MFIFIEYCFYYFYFIFSVNNYQLIKIKFSETSLSTSDNLEYLSLNYIIELISSILTDVRYVYWM